MRCFCCNKEKDPRDKGRVIVEPDGKITSYCMECDFAIWERKSPKFLSEFFDDIYDIKTSPDTLDMSLDDIDRYD